MSWRPCPDPIPQERDTVNAIETFVVPRAVDFDGPIQRHAEKAIALRDPYRRRERIEQILPPIRMPSP